ncbi:MAG: enoyl-CoA hydratase/isomerase family protein [Rhodospirillaceae bacterium]|nr:enoyl-CoA hydratase/isomerase family protein [Rhodospirillaceae bacterium]
MPSSRYDVYERLKFDWPADGVLRVTMHNPDNPLNSTDIKMHEELGRIWQDIDADRDVGAVILRGSDKAFSAGGDFSMIDQIIADHGFRMRVLKEARDIVYNVIDCSRPTIAAMNGVAVGAGLAAAMVCDVTIATRSCRIIDGHTNLGVAAGDHSVICWPLLCGMAKAKYYLLTCDTLTGEEAERIGLISLAVDDDALDAESLRVASKLANGARTAISHTKTALNNWLRINGPSFDASLGLEFLAWDGPEAKEGIAALKEKRKPNFGKMPV